ncbi:MAG: hypothetical protein M3Y74_22160, partial [Chloroflexota bacterium]|nr:hypothetical protein [Chloroflexota bacterium]
ESLRHGYLRALWSRIERIDERRYSGASHVLLRCPGTLPYHPRTAIVVGAPTLPVMRSKRSRDG